MGRVTVLAVVIYCAIKSCPYLHSIGCWHPGEPAVN